MFKNQGLFWITVILAYLQMPKFSYHVLHKELAPLSEEILSASILPARMPTLIHSVLKRHHLAIYTTKAEFH